MTTKLAAETPGPLAGLRVLVVEDDYFIADEICTTLRNGGAEVLGPSPDIEHGLDVVMNDDSTAPYWTSICTARSHSISPTSCASEARHRYSPPAMTNRCCPARSATACVWRSRST